MKLRNGLLFFALSFLLVIGAIGHSGCANIVPPTGGPRDTLPPRLLFVTPGDSTKHFTANKIVFNFDEYIDPKDIRTELIVSPVPKVEPIVDSKLRTLTVKIKDTLQPNTTYSLNFGKAIRDFNEGNILRNFRYVFTTGDHIDQGSFGGNVVIAVTGKVDSSLVVVLHQKFDDSAVVKDRPRYIARLDTTGQFLFRNIQPGTYAVYAMKDESGSHKYLSKAQLFAFADSPVVISENTPPISMYAYAEAADSKPANKSGATATTPAPGRKSAKDRERDRRLQFTVNAPNNVFDVLDSFRLSFATGLKTFDSTQLRFTDEYFRDIDPRRYRYARDTTNKVFSLLYAWPVDTKFNLILPKTFGQDSAGRRLFKDDTISFRTKKDIEYGEIRVRVLNINMARRPVLQFIQGDAVKYAIPFSNRREVRKVLFPPGEYELRILYDTNGNLHWDTGQFFGKKRQPEKVTPIRRKFTVKANWDNDVDITL
jgi:uncharacterized protein (DUF2141 family)